MAKIVLGMGSSHGPMLSTPPDQWDARVPADKKAMHPFEGREWSFDALAEHRKNEGLAAQITPELWKTRHAACRAAISELARVFHEAKPDVAVIFGNDQKEIFKGPVHPALAVFTGEKIVNSMYDDERIARLPAGVAVGIPGHIPPEGATYRGEPQLAKHIVSGLMGENFDVTTVTEMPGDETPHAYGFLYRQIMLDEPVPSVPIVLNTFYPPNQPSVHRCYAMGQAVVRAIKTWNADTRVALMASGGLTHFVIDERVDRKVLEAMATGDVDAIAALGEPTFQSGTSEIKNWVPLAGAMAELGYEMKIVDYVPCYRSLAGTGNAMAFVYWVPKG